MAVVRPARTAPPIALITFVFLFLVATGVAIYLGLQYSQASKDAEAAQEAMKTAYRPAEKPLVQQFTGGSPTITAVGGANVQLEKLRLAIDGEAGRNMPLEQLLRDVDSANKSAQSGSLLGAVSILNKQVADLKNQNDSLTQQVTAVKAQLGGLKASQTAGLDSKEKSIDQLTKEKNDLTEQLAKANADFKQQSDQQLKDTDVKFRQSDEALRDAANKRAALEEKIEQLTLIIKQLKEPAIKGNDHPILWQADGRIAHTSVGSDELWIDIGRKDRLKPNTTFTVYSPSLGVGSGPDARGKGAIEVIEVGETQSRARITHTEPGETIIEGDLIANLVFNKIGSVAEGQYNRDKARVYKFYIYGDFDLDGDGISTPSERDHIIRMVQQWGGEVVDKLDTQTDFLILGSQPGLAAAAAADAAAGTQPAATGPDSELDAQRKAQRDTYVRLLITAKDYAIPVLDANRFFAYIGYYNNTIVGKKN